MNSRLIQVKNMPTIVIIVEGNLHSGIVILTPGHSVKTRAGVSMASKVHAVDGQTIRPKLVQALLLVSIYPTSLENFCVWLIY